MCNCVQTSKIALAPGKGFRYAFDCTDDTGKVKKIELDSGNDNLAKLLAEMECSGTAKALTFDEAEALKDRLKVKHTGLGKGDSPTKEAAVIVLDPNKWTRLAQYSGTGCRISMAGKWTPGIGHPFWGPNGSPNEQLNGASKWCVLIQIHAGVDVIGTLAWNLGTSGSMNIGNYGFPTAVIAFMNDDLYNDNRNDDADPMRAIVDIF